MTVPAKVHTPGELIEDVIIKGDLAKLTPEQRAGYYREVCRSMGLNELTKPFEYIALNGKLTLYATRSCTDQLRKINGISLSIASQKIVNDVLTVHVKARDRDGREDEDWGAVPFPDTLRGDARANQILKAVTKAKRRVTLSISGLGWIDETEAETLPGAQDKVEEYHEALRRDLNRDPIEADDNPWDEVFLTDAERAQLKPGSREWREAIARRKAEQSSEDQHTRAHRENETDPVKQCVMRCKDARFHKFLEETNTAWKLMTEGTPAERAAELVRAFCGVKSRKDIANVPEAREHWHELEGRFQAWLRA